MHRKAAEFRRQPDMDHAVAYRLLFTYFLGGNTKAMEADQQHSKYTGQSAIILEPAITPESAVAFRIDS